MTIVGVHGCKNKESQKEDISPTESVEAVAKDTPSTEQIVQEPARKEVAPKEPVSLEEKLPVSGKDWQIPALGMELAYVAPGSFQMGSNDGHDNEKPIHTVRISQEYWVGKYEVTQQQYQSIMGNNPSNFKGTSNPVEKVSWNDSVSFCKKLTDQERRAGRLPEGYVYRLPTEAEWEYAARGGSRGRDTQFAGSNTIGDVAWYKDNSGSKTLPVGQKQANELGLYDMSGNVWEWCQDWWERYSSGSQTDPVGPGKGSRRVLRGGCWRDPASLCRVAIRGIGTPTRAYDILGFRVVLAPPVGR
jgi:formylglycine-generating enzyme required for sulfatase activity